MKGMSRLITALLLLLLCTIPGSPAFITPHTTRQRHLYTNTQLATNSAENCLDRQRSAPVWTLPKPSIQSNVESKDELAAKLSKTIILDSDEEDNNVAAAPLRKIIDVKSFDHQIERICQSLFQTLTSKQLERTYQRCLAIDLKHAGIKVLVEEAEINVQYKGEKVATRRADMVLQTPSDQQFIVLELKAVQRLTSESMKQLQFYMHHLDIDIGYLINFPHDTGFPDLPSTAMYRQTVLSGNTGMLSDRITRGRNANAHVQIIKVERVSFIDDTRRGTEYQSVQW